MRTLFDKSIRETTENYYPEKISFREFLGIIKRDLPKFESNLMDGDYASSDRFIEEWIKTLLAWMEIEQE